MHGLARIVITVPDGAHLAAFLVAALVLAVIPGPGMLYVLARSLAGGTRTGVRSSAGTAVGGLGHVIAAALGLSALLAASASAFEVVRLAGAAYLIWLGIQTLRSATAPPPVAAAGGTRAFRQGVLTELLNPKTALFFVTFLPQFVQPHRGPAGVQFLVLGCAVVVLNSSADLVVAALAGRLGRLLQRSPRWWKRQRVGSGLLLIGLGGAAAAAGSRS
jgi:threonine/homoserine/homoserine lactone efflux protein